MPGCCTGAGLLTDAELGRHARPPWTTWARPAGTAASGPTAADEDVHTALERGLLERVGALGGKLRAGRSRNDQVATDLRLYLRDHVRHVVSRLAELETALLARPSSTRTRPLPGMTHLQHAQPVLFGAPAAGARARASPATSDRLRDWDKRGRGQPARRGRAGRVVAAARPAGWSPPSWASTAAATNSMDAVSDRDFAAEFCFAAALLGVHLSRLGEEIVLWSSQEFGWVEIDDAYATGSSIMPQKKNPDVAELARGKAGRLIGGLTGLLTTLKGLPLTYNRDLQEDKEPVFDAVDTLLLVLPADGRADRRRCGFNAERLAGQRQRGFTLATDLAELLVQPGGAVPRGPRGRRAPGRLVPGARLRAGRRRATRTWRGSRRT